MGKHPVCSVGAILGYGREAEIAAILREYSPYILHIDDKFAFLLRCERGEIGVPKYVKCCYDAVKEFGEATFNKKDIYYDVVTRAFLECIKYHGCYIVPVLRTKRFFRKQREAKVDMKKCLEDYSALMAGTHAGQGG